MKQLLIILGVLFLVDGVGSYLWYRGQPRLPQTIRVIRSIGALIMIIVGVAM